MADTYSSVRSFAGGEVTPEFAGRIDDSKYQTGLAMCRNFVVLPHGPVHNRAGTRYVNTVKTPASPTRIIPFYYSDDQTLIIEIGVGYFRFHTQGATVLNGGVPYEVAHPYTASELFDIAYVQSADVMTLVHPNHPPAELRRLGATNFTYTTIGFNPTLLAPTTITVVPTVAPSHGALTNQTYAVTAFVSNGVDESRQGNTNFATNNLYDDGAFNTISWSAVAGAQGYNVYKLIAGQFAYIGQTTTSLSFVDDNIAPDLGKTPPTASNYFGSAGNYPSETTYFDQRRAFAATNNLPQQVWLSKTGTESNFDQSLPAQDTDAIIFRAAARDGNRVRHLVPMNELIMMTSSTVWRVTSQNSDALTPLSVGVRVQANSGASKVRPIVVNSSCLYVASRGGHMRELGYSYNAGGYTTGDVSLRAPHLFDNLDVLDMGVAAAPYPIVWAISSNGTLIGFTYVPEQQIGAFHHHDTLNGTFESVAVVPEGTEDAVYVVVNRTLHGQQTRTIERFGSRQFAAQEDAYFVDCGQTYIGAATSTISGLSWLEGETVSIFADGSVRPQQVVTGGTITLDFPASTVHVGLPITADIQTLPLSFQTPGYGEGRPKNVAAVTLRVYESLGIFAGTSLDDLTEAKIRTDEPYGSPPTVTTGPVDIVVDGGWTDDGQLYIRQIDPLPLTVLALAIDVSLGG